MNPSAGVAAWQKPARAGSGRVLKFALVSAAGLLVSDYLSGVFFLWSVHADPRRATPLTISQYGYYYGDRPDIRRRLWLCSAFAGAVVLGSLGAVLVPRRPSLYGDARFARRAEIAFRRSLRFRGHHLGKTRTALAHARRSARRRARGAPYGPEGAPVWQFPMRSPGRGPSCAWT